MGIIDSESGIHHRITHMDQQTTMDQQPSPVSDRNGQLPWYVKAAIAVVLLVILFVLGIDVLELLGAW